jgi:hypothetical protein
MNIAFNSDRSKVTLSMPGYIRKALLRFRLLFLLPTQHRPVSTPGVYHPSIYGSKQKQIAKSDKFAPLSPALKLEIQAIVGTEHGAESGGMLRACEQRGVFRFACTRNDTRDDSRKSKHDAGDFCRLVHVA